MAFRTIQIKLADGRIIDKRVDERGIVPAGGTNGQSLNKISDDDFVVDWGDATDPRLTDSLNPHGFLHFDDTDTLLSFDQATRTVTISPVPTSPFPSPAVFKYYIDSLPYETGEQSVVFPDIEGTHFIYLDHDGLLYSTQSFDVASEHAFVAVLYWDATNNLIIYQANERHSVAFDHADWKYKHLTFGTQWRSGSGLSAITPDGSGDVNSHATFTTEAGIIDDEDIRHTLAQQTTYDIFYKLGASGAWRRSDIGTTYGVYFDGTRAAYNQFTGGAWQLTTVSNGGYLLAHVFATNNLLRPYIVVMGQNQYTTIGNARAGANIDMNNLITGGMPFQEYIPVASIIYQTSNTYSNAVKSRIRTTDTGENYVNWLGQLLSPTLAPAAHNNLTGLQLAGTGVIYGHVDETTFGRIPTTDQNDAIDGANAPSAANVFATLADVGGGGKTYTDGDGIVITAGSPDDIISCDILTNDELAAINGANSPSAANVFATMADAGGLGNITTSNGVASTGDDIHLGGTITDAGVSILMDQGSSFIIQQDVVGSASTFAIQDFYINLATGERLTLGGSMAGSCYVDMGDPSGYDVYKINLYSNESVESVMVAAKAIFDHLGFTYDADYAARNTDNPRWIPDKKYVDDAVRGTKKFTVAVGMQAAFNPVDGTSYYWGIASNAAVTSTTSEQFAVRCAGKITHCVITWNADGTAGSNENIIMYVHVNGTATLIAQVGSTDAIKIFQNENMDVTVADNDLITFRVACPTWATNPTTVRITGYITFEGA